MKTLKFILLTFFLAFCYSQVRANLSKDWISYFGNSKTRIYSIEFDPVSKHMYIAGTTYQQDLGTAGIHQSQFNDSSNDFFDHMDIFVAKFTTSGVLVWFTYYGGSKIETNPSLALDKLGNIYVSGYTQSSSGIASPGAHKTSITEGADFLVKFNPQGQRLWASYYNEQSNRDLNSIMPVNGAQVAVDENNNPFMYGHTRNNSGIATPGTYQPDRYNPTGNDSANAYLVKFNSAGQRIWGTYFGGGREEVCRNIHIDQQNNIYIAGGTMSSTNIASPGAMFTQIDSVNQSISYLAKFNTNGQRIWSTYIHHRDEINRISSVATDAAGNIYLFGITDSDSGISTPGAWQQNKSDRTDFFLMKLNSSGYKVWGTYYGGEGEDQDVVMGNVAFDLNFSRNRIRLNRAVNPDIYISGFTKSITGIKKGCTIYVDSTNGSVLSKFSNNGQLIWGSKYDGGIYDFALGLNDSLYFAGNTPRDNLGSPNAHQPTKAPLSLAGLFGKFVEHFVCPTDVTIPFNRVNDSLIAPAGYSNYQWFRNDTLLQNGPQNYFILQGYYEGVYKLKVLDPCNCIFDSDTLFVAHPTSIKGTARNTMELSVAPNPATNKISVQLNHAGQQEYRFRIYNILGRKVFESDSKFDADHKKVIDLSNYAPGVYLLHVENSTGKATLKFIRQ